MLDCVASEQAGPSVEAVAPEVQADHVGGLVHGQHDRQLRGVHLGRLGEQLVGVDALVEVRQLGGAPRRHREYHLQLREMGFAIC